MIDGRAVQFGRKLLPAKPSYSIGLLGSVIFILAMVSMSGCSRISFVISQNIVGKKIIESYGKYSIENNRDKAISIFQEINGKRNPCAIDDLIVLNGHVTALAITSYVGRIRTTFDLFDLKAKYYVVLVTSHGINYNEVKSRITSLQAYDSTRLKVDLFGRNPIFVRYD